MSQHFKVLLIDDHPTMIQVYEMAFTELMKENELLEFSIEKATDYYSGIDKIKQAKNIKGKYLIILDLGLGRSKEGKRLSGEDLGILIRELLPDAKIIVSTFYNDAFKINSILRSLSPSGFLIKNDFDLDELKDAINTVASGNPYYCCTVNNVIRKNYQIDFLPDKIDTKILYELSIGTKMKEIPKIIPSMSMGGIERRKRRLKEIFNVVNLSDRALILAAIDCGFI